MSFEPYKLDELQFAYCYHVYLRWRTHCALPTPKLAELSQQTAQSLVDRFGIHVLELTADPTDVLCLMSLQPMETVAAAVSKLKGQTSKWLREAAQCGESERLFSRGYFAVTSGKSTDESVQRYLASQGEHHGNDDRWANPPVLVESYDPLPGDESRLQAAHSHTLLRLHCVLSTCRRQGVFSRALAARVAASWRCLGSELPVALLKVSFVPDHVHLALRIHPSVSPADLICRLMNEAQVAVEQEFSRMMMPPGVERLWQPSAYIGAFGQLASPQIAAYLRRWQSEA